jgi:magnesium-transporting ATPase (P-type)
MSQITAQNSGEEQTTLWHAVSSETLFQTLQSGEAGLSNEQAIERQARYGKNVLPAKEPPTLLQVFLHQFASPLIYILLAAGAIALAMGDLKDAAFIAAVVLLNAGIGTYQEWRAERSAHALQSMLQIRARVRRNGQQQTLPADELVPGDVVFVESGDKSPADMRILQANNLMVDESFLTGESQAAEKNIRPLPEETPVSDRRNMLFAGSTVAAGRGVGVVVETGLRTEVGKIARTISESAGSKPPLVIRMERFAHQITLIVLTFAAVLGVVAYSQGTPLNEVFFLMVAMAVSAIPEGLPVAMTVALSLATSRMARRNVIVRRLTAVESLGSCTLIATDKTGTLTVNQQTARQIILPDGVQVEVEGEGYNDNGEVVLHGQPEELPALQSRLTRLACAAVINNEAELKRQDGGWVSSGDAVDIAFLALGYKLGIQADEVQRELDIAGEIPFESERRYAARFHRVDGHVVASVKGAYETVLALCDSMRVGDDLLPLDRECIEQQAQEMAGRGYRVIAVAQGELGHTPAGGVDERWIPPLHLLGLVGFIDPLRSEVQEAVQRARNAGVEVVMITGDHPATALAIGRELDIARTEEEVVTGRELAEIDSENPAFRDLLARGRVFARVTPLQKNVIVQALIDMGHFVAVTGDGVNDAPALRTANIGVAMGSGTDVAKDTASMIVTDDNFASIVAGIEEGRYAYDNVRKVTLLLIATGLAELLFISLAIFSQLPLPLIAVQILWLNLVTNGIQDVALAFERGEQGAMKRSPRPPSEGIFNRPMIEQVVLAGLTMSAIIFGFWVWLMQNGWDVEAARNRVLLLLVLMQFFHVLNSRSETQSAFRIPLRNNPVLMWGMFAALLIHIAVMQIPFFQGLLQTRPVALQDWLLYAVVASSVLIVMEIYKWWVRRNRLVRR